VDHKSIFAVTFAILGASTPCLADVNPILTASRYCELRRAGISMDTALADAYQYGERPYISPVGGDRLAALDQYERENERGKVNAKLVVSYIKKDCPSFLSR
jgi:hypothetical protein